jgi:predicted dehydrogenase
MAKRNYALAAKIGERIFPAPRLPYQPPQPKSYCPRIGLIGCGGITESHLDAYRAAGWEVVALCSRTEEKARRRRDQFYPGAEIYTDYHRLLERQDVNVVDIALHPEPRAAAIEAALNAGKHVLSQKPLALHLDAGERLVALAAKRGLKFAVNQNGRWSPYFSYAAQAIRAGLIGAVQTVSVNLNWDHSWIKGTPFERIYDVVLSDFGIHWFDFAALCFAGRKARRVFAANALAPGQALKPPMIAGAVIQFDHGAATLHFDAHSRFGPQEAICITGSAGTIRARGPICAAHDLTLYLRRGCAKPELKGKWFNDGFRGAMGELLCAIEEDREASNSARDNLSTLALCFAAVKSARTGRAEVPGKVRRLAP